MSFSVLRLSQQVGRLSLSGRGNGGDAAVRSVVATWRDRINNGKAILTTNNLQVSFSSLTLPSRPTAGTVLQGRINSMFMDSTTDYSKLFPGIPQHLIPTKALPILLKDRYKGLRPSVVRKRLEKMRTYSGKQKNIRGSPWKLNLVCQLAAGLPVWEALKQLNFCNKAKAPLVAQVIQRTANLASIRDGLTVRQLEVATCFSTHGAPLKRIRYMAKGRSGKVRREFSHMNVTLREIDFDLKVAQSTSLGEMRRWLLFKGIALEAMELKQAEAKEMEELERKAQEIAEKKKAEEKKK